MVAPRAQHGVHERLQHAVERHDARVRVGVLGGCDDLGGGSRAGGGQAVSAANFLRVGVMTWAAGAGAGQAVRFFLRVGSVTLAGGGGGGRQHCLACVSDLACRGLPAVAVPPSQRPATPAAAQKAPVAYCFHAAEFRPCSLSPARQPTRRRPPPPAPGPFLSSPSHTEATARAPLPLTCTSAETSTPAAASACTRSATARAARVPSPSSSTTTPSEPNAPRSRCSTCAQERRGAADVRRGGRGG